jgi:16S rRNA processing protein RimM
MTAPLVVGRFGKTYGVSGWIKVISFTTPQENILKFQPWLIQKKDEWEEFYFEASKKHAGGVIVKLPSCNSPEEARYFTNINIGIRREQLPKLPANEFYWDDLIGLDVVNKEGVNLGKIEELIATGSNDVLVVMGDRKRLIPYISNVIIKVDLSSKSVSVDWGEDFLQ